MTAEAAHPKPFEALWRSLVRWDHGKIVPPVAIRNTIGFTLALIIATVLGNTNAGVLAGLGALNVSYSDGLEPYRVRAWRIGIASLLCGAAVTAGALSGHTNFAAVTTAAIGAFIAGVMIALGPRAGDLGVVTLVTLVVFAARPLSPLVAVQSGLVACAGGLLQMLLSIAFWPVKPYAPERKIISELYLAIADIARGTQDTSSAPPVSRQITDAQEALASLAPDHSVEAERHVFLLNQAERIRLSLINLTQLYRMIGLEPGGGEATKALSAVLQAAAVAASEIGECAINETPVRAVQNLKAVADRFRNLNAKSAPPRLAGLLEDARYELDALGGQMRAAASISSGLVQDVEPPIAALARDPWWLRFPGRLAKLRANLSFHSTVFRHALRLAACLAAGDALGRAISLQRTYWIPMTIAIVLKPDFSGTFSRGILRIGGTFAGLFLATMLFRYLHTGVATDIALMAAFMFLLRWVGAANYGVFVIAMSAMVVLLISSTGVSPQTVILARAQNTAIGGLLALIAYAIWPTWEKTQVGPTLADMIDRYSEYFEAVIQAYRGEGTGDLRHGFGRRPANPGAARLGARLARSNAEASVDRIAAEPGVSRQQIATLGAIMASSHSFVHAVMAMESGLYHTRPVPMRPATREFAIEVGDALGTVSKWLRGSEDPHAHIPDLRAAHTVILQSQVATAERYSLIDRETDGITTSVNTLAEQARRWPGLRGGAALLQVGTAAESS
jgi:uncharacterized membrane protein YccC